MTQETTPMPPALEELSSASLSRRRFLVTSGVVAGLAVVGAACGGGDDEEATGGSGGTETTAAGGGGGDAEVAAFAAGLEVLAVSTYKGVLDAAGAGKLGAVPPAGAEFVKTAMAQHQEYLDALNALLAGAGRPKVSQPNAQLKTVVDAGFARVKDFAGAAQLARELEQIAAATYLSVIPTLQSKDAIKLAGQANINDMQHIAILNYVLG
ncbi:MAG: ferritin-like domain-containing protein, partial [Actinomycetota bacterium]|nr:ferritin-like domain-containing protein [Actinomycetota bacterium]